MVQDNYEFLKNQVKFTGFGEGLDNLLKNKMEKGETQFTLNHKLEYGNDKLDATLHFSKSQKSDLYFFNKYELGVKKSGEDTEMKQSFLVSPKHTTFTVKEAHNLMSGRAVNKDMAALQKVSEGDTTRYKPTGNRYNAWVELDFNDADQHGNFKLKTYADKDKLDVAKVLDGQPIKELQSEDTKKWLIDALQKGNRYEVTITENGTDRKVSLQADPKNVAIRQFDSTGNELTPLKVNPAQKNDLDKSKAESVGASTSNKQEQDNPSKKNTDNQNKRRGARVS